LLAAFVLGRGEGFGVAFGLEVGFERAEGLADVEAVGGSGSGQKVGSELNSDEKGAGTEL
jgi:hypothetical protein